MFLLWMKPARVAARRLPALLLTVEPCLSPHHREAARDAQHLAGHVGCFVGSQVRDGARHILRAAEPAKRDAAAHALQDLGAAVARHHVGKQPGVGRAGTHDVHGHRVTGHLARERLREADDARLAGRVDRLSAAPDTTCVRGAVGVHDPDRGPAAWEPQRDGAADAAPGAGDERDGAHGCYLRPGSAAVKLPLTATSPFWLTARTSPSIRRSPSASYFRVTLPVDTIVSPGQTRVAKRTFRRRRVSGPTEAATQRPTNAAVNMP